MGAAQCKAPVAAGGCSLVIDEKGSAAVIAIYYGDRNFLSSTSTQVISQKVTDFSISAPPAPTSTEATTHGLRTSYQLTLTPRDGFTGSVSLGMPLGVTLMGTTQYGIDGAVSFGAVAGIDLLRLTLYRQTLLKWWQNPSSSGGQTARGGLSFLF